jgi:hypothetical protein
MLEDWKQTSTIRCPVLFVSEDIEINISIESEYIFKLHFDKPKKIDTASPTNWEHKLEPIYEYTVSAYFKASKDNALSIAQKRIETIASRLSFYCCSPVLIESYGSVTNAPENPQPGVNYTVESLTFDQAWCNLNVKTIPKEAMDDLIRFVVQDKLIKEGDERLERSIRWLCHSYFTASPIEEFMCLMLSFESISNLLMPATSRFWRCSHCGQDIKSCPICHSSTEWAGSGNLNMKSFVCEKLNWENGKWQDIWELRNKVFHGSQDVTVEQQQTIVSFLKPLEQAVISAIAYLLAGRKDIPKVIGRERGKFYGAKLHVEYHM